MINPDQEAQLIGSGECFLHVHPQEVLDFDDLLDLMVSQPVNTITGDYEPTKADYLILCDTSLNDIRITMPLAALGREFQIVKISEANRVFIDPTPPDHIRFSLTGAIIYNIGTSLHLKAITGGWIFV